MDQKFSLRLLEYESARQLLRRYITSAPGVARLEEMRPYTDPDRIKYLLSEVKECRRSLDECGIAPIEGLFSISPLLSRARIPRACLIPEDLLKIRSSVTACRLVNQYLMNLPSPGTHVQRFAAAITPFPELEELLIQCLDDDGEIKDAASRDLVRIRKGIIRQRENIQNRLHRLMRGRFKEYLQEDYITQRNGRYVLAVASKFKNQVKGIIHDRSDTGATTYIEPSSIIESGNNLQDLLSEEKQEIFRILVHLTSNVARFSEPLGWAVESMADLDFAMARARFGIAFKCQAPLLSKTGRLKLVDAHHPLLIDLLGDKVVPTNLRVKSEIPGLVITGPNTGGKTVVLKTVGLLCLMFQSGVEIPCGDGTELPIFESIMADIGDEQSLQQSLSTFSSHISHIRDIIKGSTPSTLVLLDELGAGTDPLEGGALGVAIVEELVGRGVYTMVTTHLNELKLMAHDHPLIDNAAMQFNEETLEPTFAVGMGRAGGSHALIIARRLGMPEEVVKRARSFMKGDNPQAAQLLHKLENEVDAASRERKRAHEERQATSRLHQETLRELQRTREERKQAGERARTASQALLAEIGERARQLKKNLRRSQKELDAALQAKIEDELTLTAMEVEEAAAHPELAAEDKKEQPVILAVEPEELQRGCRIRVNGFSGDAEVLALDVDKEEAVVLIADMQLRVPFQHIEGMVEGEPEPDRTTTVQYTPASIDSPNLDIIGKTVDEMRPELETFLDHAFLAHLPSVWIIHGYGMGTLKRAVRDILMKHPLVKCFRNGTETEGGTAITVATFKQD
jgi:DNA mismatch repair protein MutS2